MLRSYVTKKHLFFYFIAIMITWLEAIITPALIQYIVSSFTNHMAGLVLGDCWKFDSFARFGRETLLLCTSADRLQVGY